jgi:sodium-dependent dicarboxylate transporter 2/3/5
VTLLASVVVTILMLRQPAWPREAAWMGGIFVLAAGLWVTEALPLYATALVVLALEIVLLANPGGWPGLGFSSGASPGFREILAAAADPVLLLFFGGFLLARAASKEGLDAALSSLLLRPFGSRPRWVVLGLMLGTTLFSMWMSNTATAAMMMTLTAPMLAQVPAGDPLRRQFVIAVAFAANIGGLGTPIASPPNALAVGYLQRIGAPVGFLEWMLVAVPLLVVILLLAWLLLGKMFPPATDGVCFHLPRQPLSPRARGVLIIFAATVALWLTDHWHGLPAAAVALLPAIVLTATGLLDRRDVAGIDWDILILIAGGIALGAGMQMTGLDRIVAGWLPTEGLSLAALAAVLIAATIVLSTFMSNTAATNLLLPIGMTAAAAFGGTAPQVRILLGIALAAGLSMALPVSTPPNAIAYASGEISTRDLLRPGLVLSLLAALLVLLVLGPLLHLAGLGR